MVAVTSWERLADDFSDVGDFGGLILAGMRLLIAALLGGLLGFQREQAGKAAGLRTHMLVSVGAAMFVVAPQMAGIELSRVIQGVVTGIGFLGGGTILKLSEERRIKGLTTAAGIWLTAAVGIAAGIGRLGTALVGTVLALVILGVLYRLDPLIGDGPSDRA
jgi:putative Mg2+ transporter-C (MgtC) family protein